MKIISFLLSICEKFQSKSLTRLIGKRKQEISSGKYLKEGKFLQVNVKAYYSENEKFFFLSSVLKLN
jgi:hypothetical protein